MFAGSFVIVFIYNVLASSFVTSLCQILLLLHKYILKSFSGLNKLHASSFVHGRTRIHYFITRTVSIRHLVGFKQDSARYINKLVRSSYEPIFKIWILTKDVTVVNPELNRAIAKNSENLSLAAVVASTIGKSVFPLSNEGRQLFTEFNTQTAFHTEFIGKHGLQLLLEKSAGFITGHMETLPDQADVRIGEWTSRLTAATVAHAVFGSENPWNMDEEFMNQFLTLAETYDTLYYPAPYLTARSAYIARKILLSKLRGFHKAHRNSYSKSVAHRLNLVALSDPNWERNPDYYMVELLMSLAIFPTLSTLTVWLLRHLLADPPLLKTVVSEIEQLGVVRNGQEKTTSTIDLGSLRTSCPWLVASWHEALRLHMTVVPRSVQKEFDLVVPSTGNTVSLNAGDILLMPMCASNMDPNIWGPDFGVFSPARFITPSGKLSIQLTRKVRGFGIAGNLCPGRHYSFTTAMSIIVAVFLTFDIHGKDNKGFRPPKPAGGFSGGFERHGNDELATLSRRTESVSRRLEFSV